MIIGGIQKTSLIDFASKISCVLFTAGCNFDCPYCHNPELVNAPFTPIAQEEIFAFLEKRQSLLDGVVITGGEPTLHKDLPAFCEKIKSLGFLLKLDTNGSRPEILRSLIKNRQVDYIAMDVKTLPDHYFPDIAQHTSAETILESIHLIRNSGISHEFRTTCVKPFVTADIIQKIAHLIHGADLFVLQQAAIGDTVLHPDFFDTFDWKIKPSELKSFQHLAAPFVKKVSIRS